MRRVNLAEAKAHLSELVEQAAAGEAVCITRRGRPVARITGVEPPRLPVDLAMLRALTDAAPMQPDASGFIRRMRDTDRF